MSRSKQKPAGSAPVGFVYHAGCLEHSNGAGHPERPERVASVRRHLERHGDLEHLVQIEPQPCEVERLARVHDPAYVEAVRRACERAPARLDPDTGVSSGSWQAALLSAGGAIAACDAVMSGEARCAFVAGRPPGHHAEAARAMGFCLFNNVAVAARYLQDRHGAGRVFIVDWDVHHGNGTQHIFETDDSVFYYSVHQFPFYPGTGGRDERGRGAGEGYTLNTPLPAGCGDGDYEEIFRRTVVPAIDRFDPDVVLLSAGFDAHRDDPIGGMEVTAEGYATLTGVVKEVAAARCDGRIVSLLEGGYSLSGLAASVRTHLAALGAPLERIPQSHSTRRSES